MLPSILSSVPAPRAPLSHAARNAAWPQPAGEPARLAPRGYERVGSQLRQALGTARCGQEEPLHALLALAGGPADQPLQLPGHEQPPTGSRCSPENLEALFEVYRAHVPPPEVGDEAGCRQDAERALGALKVLVERGLSAQALETLIRRGRDYDVFRSTIASVLVFASSFFPAGLMTLWANSMVTDSAAQSNHSASAAQAEPEALWQQLLPWGAWAAGNVVIGLGGEGAAAVLREAGWQAGYNRPLARGETGPGAQALVPMASRPLGECVQAAVALPFGLAYIAHTLAGGRLGPGLARLGLGALAAATGGTWRELALRGGADAIDPVWLDGSSPDRQHVMHDAIERLQSPGVALKRAADDLLQGVEAAGRPSTTALQRCAARALLAAVARGGQAIATATGTAADWRMQVAADGWLGAVWGSLSTLPSRAFGAGSARPAERGRPDQIAPAPSITSAPSAPSAPSASPVPPVPPMPARDAAAAARASTPSGFRHRGTPKGRSPDPARLV